MAVRFVLVEDIVKVYRSASFRGKCTQMSRKKVFWDMVPGFVMHVGKVSLPGLT